MIASDYRKIRKYGASVFSAIFLSQSFWAIFQYRIAHSWYRVPINKWVKLPITIVLLVWQKIVEVITGISLPASATIGHSFYIGHFGPVIVHPKTVIGNNCNLSQGVTIGISGTGEKRGVPVIMDNVYIGPNAVVAGNIRIANNVAIGALTLVIRDVEEYAVVSGVPSSVISHKGSAGYI